MALLDGYAECPQYANLEHKITLAREMIEKQIEHCRKDLEAEEQTWLFSQIPAARKVMRF